MQRVTKAEAARQLGVNRSTIGRWIEKSPDLVDKRGRVNVAQLQAFSEQGVDHALRTTPKAVKGPDTEPAPEPMPVEPEDDPEPVSYNYNQERARREAARADEAELDLAHRKGLTLRRIDVENAAADAGEAIRQAAAALSRDAAERLAQIDDPREMEAALDDVMRSLLHSAASALGKMAGESGGDADAA